MRKLKIIITTGDPDGIGAEVTAKALRELGPQAGVTFLVMRDKSTTLSKLRTSFQTVAEANLADALARDKVSPGTLIEVRQTSSPAHWVEEAARACFEGQADALVTAPLSKLTIQQAGMKEIGHTEILARVAGLNIQSLFMGFIGAHFNVVLASGHQPLKVATATFNSAQLRRALKAADQLRRILPKRRSVKPLALVGLNPHAGENGLIGREEEWFRSTLHRAAPGSAGPLVPDAAFLPNNWPKYSVYVCPYHDQGLIPFKMVHGFAGGVHLTLGLPFVRTSVDHGTAKELYGLNKAESGSMREALLAAIRLAKERRL